jgi:hypothetical protein
VGLALSVVVVACSKGGGGAPVKLGSSGWQVTAPSGVEAAADSDGFAFKLSDPAETSRIGTVFPFAGDMTEDAVKTACAGADVKVEKLANGFVATCGEGKSWSSASVVKVGDEAMECEWNDLQRGSRDAARAVCASLTKK